MTGEHVDAHGVIRSKGNYLELVNNAYEAFHDLYFQDIAIEGQYFGARSNPKSIHKVGVAGGLLVGVACSIMAPVNIGEIIIVDPRRWTSKLLGGIPGKDSKAKMKLFVNNYYGISPRADEADALCIGHCVATMPRSEYESRVKGS